MKTIFRIFISLLAIEATAQTSLNSYFAQDTLWMNVGNPGFTAGTSIYVNLRISPSGQLYVACSDWGYGKNLSVMKYEGNGWVNVGTPGFSQEGADWVSLAFSPMDEQPYVAFSDQRDNTKKASVMKFDGTDWVYVGSPEFSESITEYTSLAFSPSGEPYVAFADHNQVKASVMKFDGMNWVYVGTPGFSQSLANFTNLAFSPSGVPYVVFSDYHSDWKATVMKFNGAAWENVGIEGFSAGRADYTCLTFSSSGQPYVAYSDGGNSDKATVMKFDGTSWVNVGNAGFSEGWAWNTSIAFGPDDGLPYVAFGDSQHSGKASLMKFDGTAWVYIGNPGFSEDQSGYTSLAFSSTGVPHVAYTDQENMFRITVMKYDSVGVGINEIKKSSVAAYPNPAKNIIEIGLSQITGSKIIEIVDIEGQVAITYETVESNVRIDISKIPSGMYFLRLKHSGGIKTGMFVKL